MRVLGIYENLLSEDVTIIIQLMILSPFIYIAWDSLTVQASPGYYFDKHCGVQL